MREGAGMSQAELGAPFGWLKDAISKIERGDTNISLFNYLQVVEHLKDLYPDHPALALHDFLTKPRRRRK